MRTIQAKIPEILGGKSNGTEIPGDKFPKIWVCMSFVRLSYFPKILENAVPFVTENFKFQSAN